MSNRLLALLSILVLAVFGALVVVAQVITLTRPVIRLDAAWRIRAGEAWELNVTVDHAAAGEAVTVRVFNGLQRLETTLTLGTGGVALWQVPEGLITQAGVSVVMVQTADVEKRRLLRVIPERLTLLELFSTANIIPAYGEGDTTLMILPRDTWGNPPTDVTSLEARVRYPDGSIRTLLFDYAEGIGWVTMPSQGEPGRVRVQITEEVAALLELVQAPGTPESVRLHIRPGCVLNDGRDRVTLEAQVSDAEGSPVVDGILVTFTWPGGFGTGRTIDGRAMLSLPAPTQAGTVTFTATAATITSAPAALRVTDGVCG
ncbi:MAG: hypothetical protein OHK0046_50380 [Anaerolineae bacterium]